MRDHSKGRVYLIGTGPGDPGLLTMRAYELIRAAQVVVHDRLVSDEIMALVPSTTQCIDVGKMPRCHKVPQEDINALLVDLAAQGLVVARLKGGDPLIFGRGSEEAAVLHAAGIPVDYVPGITAAQGVAASTGVPLTHRGLATSVRYVTGHRAREARLDLDWASLASAETTLVVYMGVASITEISAQLIAHGMAADMPVLAVARATTPQEVRLVSTLARIPADAHRAGLEAPVLFVIGQVVTLYDPAPLAALAHQGLPCKVAAHA